jgi:hypothetical protein
MNGENKIMLWVKRLGVAGFIFFTIKGLLWLIIPAVLVWWGANMGQ